MRHTNNNNNNINNNNTNNNNNNNNNNNDKITMIYRIKILWQKSCFGSMMIKVVAVVKKMFLFSLFCFLNSSTVKSVRNLKTVASLLKRCII